MPYLCNFYVNIKTKISIRFYWGMFAPVTLRSAIHPNSDYIKCHHVKVSEFDYRSGKRPPLNLIINFFQI